MEELLVQSAALYAREAGELVAGLMNKPYGIQQKVNRSDLVTEADVSSEKLLRGRIGRDYPDHWILSEESDGANDPFGVCEEPPAGYGWIIDPIDGTINFIHGTSHFAISIGIVKDGVPVAGVVYNPLTDEMFTARLNGGAYVNGERIQVGSEAALGDALLATGFQASEWRPGSGVVEQIGRVVGTSRSMRIMGAASLDLCMVASGKLTGFWHGGLYPWDAAAGIVILSEAGGVVTTDEGRPYRLSDTTLVASNRLIHDGLLGIVASV
ncbi:inositol monophosphatase family protein [Paenibacillus hodogayensis]|uniref:Inositol-1-monophosphatase n=1 Tax=Paenibacillus hodogayensis TaxID=279208 RepID=A0ABV5VUE0_9BACL